MNTLSKNRKKILKEIDLKKVYTIDEAINLLRENSFVKFDETLDIAIKLNIDSNKTDQNIRGVINLPKGIGKTIKIAVMAKGDKAKEAKENGADIVGDDELSNKILSGKIDFDILITTPDMMPAVGKLAKILGPKGLMPNAKFGTVTQDLSSAIKNTKLGQVRFKNDKSGIVHAGVGKIKFKNADLLENIKAFYDVIHKSKPEAIKGSFIKKVTIASTMGFGLTINQGDLR